MDRYYKIPYSEWKCYAVPVKDPYWGSGWYYVEAPNKTLARKKTIGEVNPDVKVKGKIREVAEKDYPKLRVFGPKNFDGWKRKW
jgi:hypothetical protein